MVTDSVPKYKARSFAERVRNRADSIHSWLCVGIDPDPVRLPAGLAADASGVGAFCREIVCATSDVAVCFKVNVAFFEAFGPAGWEALARLRDAMPDNIPVMLDAKRGDIGNTSAAYARSLFDLLRADAVTVSPYLGWDALEPFTAYEGRGVFVLCRTSNPGSRDVQELEVGGEPLYLHVAREAIGLDVPADVGLVVGATQPDALRRVRALDDDVILLAPGVGAQGATAAEAIAAGGSRKGDNVLASVSRDILYASRGADYSQAAAESARRWAAESWHAKESVAAAHR
jgi:orotidine-5'-phosphate decarboxylase